MPEDNIYTEHVVQEWKQIFHDNFELLFDIPSAMVQAEAIILQDTQNSYDLGFILQRLNANLKEYDEEDHKFFLSVQRMSISPFLLPYKQRYKMISNVLPQIEDLETRSKIEIYLKDIEGITTPNSKQIRKYLFPKLIDEFNAEQTDSGGGTWWFDFEFGRKPFKLLIDTGGMATFRYNLYLIEPDTHPPREISYETLLRLLGYDWDLLADTALDEQTDLLIRLIRKTLGWSTIK